MKKIKKIGTVLLASSMLFTNMPVYALSKNETVYSKLDNTGSVKQTIVSEYLKNTEKTINDETNLKNILNLNGDERYKIDGTSLVWDAKGKDIYYQGETEAELPIDLNISYKLNGENIELKDLLGKEGKVEITLKYTNKEKHTVLVNGTYENLYTPFIVTLGTIISNDNNSNIEVTNGKVVSNGQNSIIVAIASPGLYESLNMDNLKDFDTITLKYDTKKFELSSIYSVISSNLISDEDLKVFDKVKPIYENVNKLSEASKELVNGSNELLEGTKKLTSGVKELNEGINKAYVGSKTINDTLTSKINNLENSSAIDDEKLAYIKTQATEGALATYEVQKDTIKETTLKIIIDNETTIKEQAIAKIKENDTYKYYEQKIKEAESVEGFTNLVTICNVEDPTTIPQVYLATCNQQKEIIKNYLTAKQVLILMETVSSETAYMTSKQVAVETALTTSKNVSIMTASNVSENVAKSVANASKETTVSSLNTLNENITVLTNGLYEIDKGSNELVNGTNTLTGGVETLADGISKFNNEGIGKISNLVNGDLKSAEERIKALIKLGNAYDSFTLKSDDTKGETKFVLIVDGEKLSKEENKVKETSKKETIIDKIKKVFK